MPFGSSRAQGLKMNTIIPTHLPFFNVKVCACECGDQERVSDLLKLELHAAMSHPVWVLGTELYSVRSVYALNC